MNFPTDKNIIILENPNSNEISEEYCSSLSQRTIWISPRISSYIEKNKEHNVILNPEENTEQDIVDAAIRMRPDRIVFTKPTNKLWQIIDNMKDFPIAVVTDSMPCAFNGSGYDLDDIKRKVAPMLARTFDVMIVKSSDGKVVTLELK